MNAPVAAKPPGWFWAVAVLALLWNLFGLAMYYMSVTMTPEQLAQLPAAQREVTEGYPTWLWGVYGVAVVTGTDGDGAGAGAGVLPAVGAARTVWARDAELGSVSSPPR